MKGNRLKILILSVLFLATTVIALVGGKEAGESSSRGSAFQAASLPVLCFSWQDQLINPLYGYTDMQTDQAGAEQPAVYPFTEEEQKLEIRMLDLKERPRGVSYELRDEEDGRLMAQGRIEEFAPAEEDWAFSVEFQDILTPDRYYLLNITVSLSRRSASYHTRVMKVTDRETVMMLTEYARNLHDDLFHRDTARAYMAQLETDTNSDKDTLAFVTLKSSFEQFCWGDAGIRQKDSAWMTIRGIQGNYLYLDYAFLAEWQAGEESVQQYRVTESVTLQRYGLSVYLLDYERHMDQLWSFTENSVVTQGILLGIQEEENLQCRISENQRFCCFSVGSELYLYDSQETRLTKIFSFHQTGEHPLRTLQKEYDIRIMDVRDSGEAEFAVYGYMNGGTREGSCGISYCRYDREENQVREQVFLSSVQAPASLMLEVRRLFTKGNDNFLYFILDEELLVMDIDTGETAVLVSRQEYPGLVVSDSGTIFAWASETDQEQPGALRIIDLNTGERKTLTASDGEFIRPLGFLREDLAVGYGPRNAEMIRDGAGSRYPYDRIVIYDSVLSPLYRYHDDAVWIDHVTVLRDKMEIHRFSFSEGKYSYLTPDIMLRSDAADQGSQYFTTVGSDTLKNMKVLKLERLPSSLRIEQTATRLFAEGQRLELPASHADAPYYYRCFACGSQGITGAYATLGEAAAAARDVYGFVLYRDGSLAWYWSGKQDEKVLEVGSGILDPGPDWENVSGVSLRELITFLNRDVPVRWGSPDRGDLWLIGYEWKNVVLYNPQNANVFRMLQSDFDEAIARDNNYLWIQAP